MQSLSLLAHAGPWLYVSESWDNKESPVHGKFPKYLLMASTKLKK